MTSAERTKRFEPLGYTRQRILSCLGADMPSLPWYLELGADEDVFSAFRAFVQRMIQTCAAAEDQPTRALVGAARLLIGDIAGADEVLEHLPPARVKLDHGAGYCLLVPMQAMQTALPLPANLSAGALWHAGSAEQTALREWIEQHRSQLKWGEGAGVYHFASGNIT